jgi:hypothetical protein
MGKILGEPIFTYAFGISTKKDTLRLIKRKYANIIGIKGVQKAKKKPLGSQEIAIYKIHIPFEIIEVKRSRSWLGNGFQSDDINCYSEWTEKVKKYDEKLLSEFIIKCFAENGIEFQGNTNQIL